MRLMWHLVLLVLLLLMMRRRRLHLLLFLLFHCERVHMVQAGDRPPAGVAEGFAAAAAPRVRDALVCGRLGQGLSI